jgi:hypothetical protein
MILIAATLRLAGKKSSLPLCTFALTRQGWYIKMLRKGRAVMIRQAVRR